MAEPRLLAQALVLALAALGAGTASVAAQEVEFDLSQLAQNGLSSDVAAFFAKEARFLPGTHVLQASINGSRATQVQVRFDDDGAPCFDAELLAALGLVIPDDGADACIDLPATFAGSRIVLRPGSAQMEITVPQQALLNGGRERLYARGGSAFVLNYDLFAQRMENAATRSAYVGGRVEAGFNVANWVVRSRGDYARRGEQGGYTQQETFAQRPLERLSSLLQVGQIVSASDGFGGMPLWGVQLASDEAQRQLTPLAVPITGTAASHAVVEVRQRGNIIHRSVVAPGPFSIDAVGAPSGGADLDVEVVEEDGRSTRFSVPGPLLSADAPLPASYQLGMGQYRGHAAGQAGPSPWLAYGGYAFDLRPGTRLSASALLSTDFQAAQAQAAFSVGERSGWGAGVRASNSDGVLGHELQVQGNTSFNHGFAAGVSWQLRSDAFRTLDDTLSVAEAPLTAGLQTLSTSVSWSSPRWGSFSYGLWASQAGLGTETGHSFSASRRFGRVTTSLTMQHAEQRGTSAFLNLQVPLGGGSVSGRAYRFENGSQTLGTSYQNRTADGTSYQLDATRSDDAQQLGASASRQTAYGSFNGGVSQSSSGTRVLRAGASGGLVLTGDGSVALSSSKVSDTFAIVRIPGVAGVRMNGAGAGKTSVLGTTVVPAVAPYRRTRVQLDGKTLPLNYRFSTTTLDLSLARGSVGVYTIDAQELRQLLLSVTTPAGDLATVGSALYDGAGEFIGTVIGDGNAVLTNEQIGQPLFMEHQGNRCEVRYQAPSQFDADRPYEEVTAQCV